MRNGGCVVPTRLFYSVTPQNQTTKQPCRLMSQTRNFAGNFGYRLEFVLLNAKETEQTCIDKIFFYR